MRKGYIGLCVLLLGTYPASAQNSDSAVQARQAAAREMLLARGEDQIIQSMIETVSENYVAQLRKAYPAITGEQLQSLQRLVLSDLSATKDDYLNHVIDVYAEYFSVTDMKAAVTFYKSDVGKKMVTLSPTLVPLLGSYQAEWTSAAISKATKDLNASLKAPQ